MALLDERERELQEAVLTGPPPLGPGASAADRLGAEHVTALTGEYGRARARQALRTLALS